LEFTAFLVMGKKPACILRFLGCAVKYRVYNLVMRPNLNEPAAKEEQSYFSPVLFTDLLSQDETQALIRRARNTGFVSAEGAYPPTYRNNDRLVIDTEETASWLFERLGARLPALLVDEEGVTWRLHGFNSRFRMCRYHGGQHFSIHRDGAHFESSDRRSFLTAMVYLNGHEEFVGGSTRFFDKPGDDRKLTKEIWPQAGAAVVFDHRLWHDGAPVEAGSKYIMRTDIMYERCSENESTEETRGHNGYIWSLAWLDAGQYASGGRDKTIRIWSANSHQQVLLGHNLSVTTMTSDGSGTLWTGSRDGTLRSWHRHDDNQNQWHAGTSQQAHDGTIVSMSGVHRGLFATGSADASVAVWHADGSLKTRLHRHESWVWALGWSPSGDLFSGSEDGTIVCSTRMIGTGRPVRALVCLEDGLVSGDNTGLISLWDYDLQRLRLWKAHDAAITALLFLPDGRLASASEDCKVRIWDFETGLCVQNWEFDDFVRALALDDRGQLLCAGYDGLIHKLSLASATNQPARVYSSPEPDYQYECERVA
jgi:WD40 repeat protein